MVEGARLEIVCALIAHLGFKSLTLRQISIDSIESVLFFCPRSESSPQSPKSASLIKSAYLRPYHKWCILSSWPQDNPFPRTTHLGGTHEETDFPAGDDFAASVCCAGGSEHPDLHHRDACDRQRPRRISPRRCTRFSRTMRAKTIWK